jgi:transcription termination factor NusB
MKDELIKYRLFNIFYNREEELDYLKKVVEEETSINFRDEKEENEWRKKARIRFCGFLYEQELKHRRAHKNLRLRTYYESYVIMNELLSDIHSFSLIVQKRLEKIQKDWNHFTAFQRVDDAPATNNAIENYYSTSLKGQNKKQLRTDRGINLHMKLSSMKRLNLIGKPKITFLEVILKLIPFRAAG